MAAPEDTSDGGMAEVLDPSLRPTTAADKLVAVLGAVAASLVALTVYAAVANGFAALGTSFLAAVVLFGATVGVFEVGRSLGAR